MLQFSCILTMPKHKFSYTLCRHFWKISKYQKQEKPKADLHIYNEPPKNVSADMIGPAHPESNIRAIKLHIPEHESANHKRFREMRQESHQWNHLFWAKHNRNFFQQKEEYVKLKLSEKREKYGQDADQTLTPEELSEFYQRFLNENYSEHIQYNREWYKRNLKMLWPAFLVFIENFRQSLRR